MGLSLLERLTLIKRRCLMIALTVTLPLITTSRPGRLSFCPGTRNTTIPPGGKSRSSLRLSHMNSSPIKLIASSKTSILMINFYRPHPIPLSLITPKWKTALPICLFITIKLTLPTVPINSSTKIKILINPLAPNSVEHPPISNS